MLRLRQRGMQSEPQQTHVEQQAKQAAAPVIAQVQAIIGDAPDHPLQELIAQLAQSKQARATSSTATASTDQSIQSPSQDQLSLATKPKPVPPTVPAATNKRAAAEAQLVEGSGQAHPKEHKTA